MLEEVAFVHEDAKEAVEQEKQSGGGSGSRRSSGLDTTKLSKDDLIREMTARFPGCASVGGSAMK